MNRKEEKDFFRLQKHIKENGKVRISDILHIIGNLWRNRTLFGNMISRSKMLLHGKKCRQCRLLCCWRKCGEPKVWKRHDNLIKNGEKRFYKEIDIVNVLNTLRMFKIFFTRAFSPEKRLLLKL
jgi:hypothetical protein